MALAHRVAPEYRQRYQGRAATYGADRLYVHDHFSDVSEKAGVTIRHLHVVWRCPSRPSCGVVPRTQWLFRIRVDLPEITKRAQGDDSHAVTISCAPILGEKTETWIATVSKFSRHPRYSAFIRVPTGPSAHAGACAGKRTTEVVTTGRYYGRMVGSTTAKPMPSPLRSATTWSPSRMAPCSNSSASGSCIRRCNTRLSGRAP